MLNGVSVATEAFEANFRRDLTQSAFAGLGAKPRATS